MLEPETRLPIGWVDVLDEIYRRLDHSIAAADVRIREAPTFEAQPMVAQRNAEIAQWNDRLQRLSAFIQSSEAGVRVIDDALAAEEKRARQDVDRCTRLQQKLADCTHSAIG